MLRGQVDCGVDVGSVLRQRVIFENGAFHLAVEKAVAVVVCALEFTSHQEIQGLGVIQFPAEICRGAVIPVQHVVRVAVGATQFRCDGQGTGVEDVLAEVEVVKTATDL